MSRVRHSFGDGAPAQAFVRVVGGASLAPHRLRAPHPCDVGNSREVGVWLCVGQWVGARGLSNPLLPWTHCVRYLAGHPARRDGGAVRCVGRGAGGYAARPARGG